MAPFANVHDLRKAAQRRLPTMFFDYVDGGSFSETTLRSNSADFDRYCLRQSVLHNVDEQDLTAGFLGRTHALPIMLGPVGFAGLLWPGGEAAVARAAAQAQIPICLSSFSIASLEDVATQTAGTMYFQSYMFRDRTLSDDLAARALAAGVEALFLTVDTSVSGVRERDTRNGFRVAGRLPVRSMLDIARHPRWALSMARKGMPSLGNFSNRPDASAGLMAQAAQFTRQLDPRLTWHDIDRFREKWPGKLVVKGIMSVEDAGRAADCGADAIVVSNHGGRQLDTAPSSISVLGDVADAVGQRLEVFFDGGIRRGSDVVKALALGARAVLLGRAYAYGLAAAGQTGVASAIELIAHEFKITLALMGIRDLSQLRSSGRDVLIPNHH